MVIQICGARKELKGIKLNYAKTLTPALAECGLIIAVFEKVNRFIQEPVLLITVVFIVAILCYILFLRLFKNDLYFMLEKNVAKHLKKRSENKFGE